MRKQNFHCILPLGIDSDLEAQLQPNHCITLLLLFFAVLIFHLKVFNNLHYFKKKIHK